MICTTWIRGVKKAKINVRTVARQGGAEKKTTQNLKQDVGEIVVHPELTWEIGAVVMRIDAMTAVVNGVMEMTRMMKIHPYAYRDTKGVVVHTPLL